MVVAIADIFLPLAFGFAAPGLAIAGIALAAIPIIIHLLNKRRHKTHQWAAMQYLLEALRRNRRRLQFENWLLLLMRCLAVVLIAFALARPMGCSEATAARFAAQAARLHVIVIDNSASMSYRVDQSDARTCLERAQRIAERLIRQQRPGDAVCIITASRTTEPTGPVVPSHDLEASLAAVGRIQQEYTTSDLPTALQRAVSVAAESSGYTSRRLYIITDATRPAWQDPAVVDSLRQLGRQLAALYDVAHIDVGDPAAQNQAVSEIRMLSSIATTAMPVDFRAEVQTYGESLASLIWQSGSRVLGTVSSSALSADRKEHLLPQVSFTADQPTAITARLEPGDRVPADDARSLAFSVHKRLNVLVVQSDIGTGGLQSPGTFLQLALAPNQSEEDPAHVDVIAESELASQALHERDAIIITAPSLISPADVQQIRRYLEDGGTLVMIMGEGTNVVFANNVLVGQGLLPGKISSIMNLAEGQEPYRFDFNPEGNLHPLLRIFRGQQNSGLSTARIWTYARVDIDPQLHVQRVLDFVGGDPAITLHNIGRGRVAFFATSADIRWSTLPAKTAFVALIHELLLGTVQADDSWRNIAAGERLEIPRRILDGNQPVLSDPAGRALVLEPAGDDKPHIAFQSLPLREPGLYRLQIDGSALPVSVAFPAAESDVTHLDSAAIRRALGDIEMNASTNELPAEFAASSDRGDFSWPLLLVAAVLLLCESFMAMWFRR